MCCLVDVLPRCAAPFLNFLPFLFLLLFLFLFYIWHLCNYQVMTYDASNAYAPGPNAPLPWVRENLGALLRGSGDGAPLAFFPPHLPPSYGPLPRTRLHSRAPVRILARLGRGLAVAPRRAPLRAPSRRFAFPRAASHSLAPLRLPSRRFAFPGAASRSLVPLRVPSGRTAQPPNAAFFNGRKGFRVQG